MSYKVLQKLGHVVKSVMSTTSPVDKSRVAGSSSQVTASSSMSLLSELQAPAQLELMRKWKVRINAPPHTGTTRKNRPTVPPPKEVGAVQRAKESDYFT